ncbi:MAG: O-antigen/teichoic acid export membrane protein, partial [Vicingaceae bacterium]
MKTRLLTFVQNNKEKGFVLTDQGLVSGINFLLSILLARFLGVELFGIFSLTWMVVIFSSSVQQAFLTAPLFALTAKRKNTACWYAQLLSIQTILSMFSFLLVFVVLEITCYFQPHWEYTGVNLTLSLLVAVYLFNDF